MKFEPDTRGQEKQERLRGAYQNVFANPDAELIVQDLIERGYVYNENLLEVGSPDLTGEKLGMRKMALYVLRMAGRI